MNSDATWLNRTGNPIRPLDRISGVLPGALGQNSALRTLVTVNTRISGSLPQFVKSPIEVLQQQTGNDELAAFKDRGSYGYSGRFPDCSPVNTPNLHSFVLEFNSGIKGTLPRHLLSLTTLAIFSVIDTGISGTIGNSGNTSLSMGLIKIAISNSRVSGEIPAQLDTFKNLADIQFHSTDISGTSPGIPHLSIWIGFNCPL